MIWPIIKKLGVKIGINFSKKQTVGNGSTVVNGKNNHVNIYLNKPEISTASKTEDLTEKLHKLLEENTVRDSQYYSLSHIYKHFKDVPREDVFKALNILLNRRHIKELGRGCDDQTRLFCII